MFLLKQLVMLVLSFLLLVGCQTNETLSDENNLTNDRKELVGDSKKIEGDETEESELEVQEEIELDNEVEATIEDEVFVERYEIDPVSWRIKSLDDSDDQVILLTIDDAPDQYSVVIAEKLKELGAGAIFFVNGHFLKSEEEQNKLKVIHELGFEIGNHTMNHPNMSDLSEENQKREIIELNDLIEEIIGERPKFYRAPFGVNTDESRAIVGQEGMIFMNWTYGYDWEQEYQDAEALAKIMVESPLLSNGANLLMHDRKWTAEAIENIVIGLRERGYEPIDPREIKIN
ncbi:polysaccharide deacetylase family protein [Alkalihalobacillus deserti]|uniref:polysaccharide deacetylase family protein n=1 Tax=Alkalihalobacillus deserti TaxID=2879466 RepID=UPI0027E12CD3|nr:polysaccharide deacetylase family protein [Alkalihalobacillus deserti]